MPLTFHIPGALREFTDGRNAVRIDGKPGTVGEALSELWTLYPGVRDRIVDEQGQVRQHVNIFIGNENIRYTGGLASGVAENSEIAIVPAVSGGLGNQDPENFRRGVDWCWTRRQGKLIRGAITFGSFWRVVRFDV